MILLLIWKSGHQRTFENPISEYSEVSPGIISVVATIILLWTWGLVDLPESHHSSRYWQMREIWSLMDVAVAPHWHLCFPFSLENLSVVMIWLYIGNISSSYYLLKFQTHVSNDLTEHHHLLPWAAQKQHSSLEVGV